MSKQLVFGITHETAEAEAKQVNLYFDKVDELGKQASNTMLAICPIINHLKSTNGWILLDGYTEADGKHQSKTFGKWAESYFNKPHSTMSETISVASRFFDDNGNLKNADHGRYTYTQLLRMRKFDDNQISEYITPEMSTADIKKKVAEVMKTALPETKETTEAVNTGVPEAIKAQMTGVELPAEPEPEPENVSRETLSTVSVNELPIEIANALIAIMDANGINEITIMR